MSKNIVIDEQMLHFAFRYALGRKTVAPMVAIANIKANMEELSSRALKAFIKEIYNCDDLGMEMDKQMWYVFADFLELELKKRA